MSSKLLPSLPILGELINEYSHSIKLDISNVYVIAVQHILVTTGSLFEYIIKLGIKSSNIFLTGKLYSTNKDVYSSLEDLGINMYKTNPSKNFGQILEQQEKDVKKIWRDLKCKTKSDDLIIILDDGGVAIRTIPDRLIFERRVFGIEQTTFGMKYKSNIDYFPVIEVAKSAAKVNLEPNFISRALNKKIQYKVKRMSPKKIGVVGCGNIGLAMIRYFQKDNEIITYDNAKEDICVFNAKRVDSIETLMKESDIIIGATGNDICQNIDWENIINSNKVFISVSSNDTEFKSLLLQYNKCIKKKKYRILDDLRINLTNGYQIKIIRGGTPANFDNSYESCDKNEIELTRALLFSGILQILIDENYDENTKHVKLSSKYQEKIVQLWFKNNPSYTKLYPQNFIQLFHDRDWIEMHS